MSTLSVTQITTGDNTTPLILTTGNGSSGFIKIETANDDIIFVGLPKFTVQPELSDPGGGSAWTLGTNEYNLATNTYSLDCATGNYFELTANGTAQIQRTVRIVDSTAEEFGSSTSGTMPLPEGLEVGDLVIVGIGSDGNTASLPSGWTNVHSTTSGTEFARTFYRVMTDPPNTTVAITNISTATAGIAVALRGANVSTLTSNVTTGATGMPDPGAISVNPEDFILAFGYLDDDSVAQSVIPPSGFKLEQAFQSSTAGQTVMLASKTAETSETINPSAFRGSGNDEYVALTLKISPATGFIGTNVVFTNVSTLTELKLKVNSIYSARLGGIKFINTTKYHDVASELFFDANTENFIEAFTSNGGSTWYIETKTGYTIF